jgi:hypothetical protein
MRRGPCYLCTQPHEPRTIYLTETFDLMMNVTKFTTNIEYKLTWICLSRFIYKNDP